MTAQTADRVTAELSEIDVHIEIKNHAVVDLPGLIRQYRDEYLGVDLDGGYQEWERPSVFLSEYLNELVDVGFGPDDGKHVRDRSYSDDLDIDFRWTAAHYDALLVVCPEANPDFGPSPEDLARRPGPLDVPLPLDGA